MWPFGGTKQENGELFSEFMPEHIDLVKRSEPNTKLPLDESIGEIVCDKCQAGIRDAERRGTYLVRTSGKGVSPIVKQCATSCTHIIGKPEDAIIRAIIGE